MVDRPLIGIDFGTSNSAIAVVAANGAIELARFVPSMGAGEVDTAPTVLFFPSYEGDTHFGHRAVARYLFTGLEGRFVQSMKTFLPAKTFTGTQIRGRTHVIEDLVAEFLTQMIEAAEQRLGIKIQGPLVLGRPAMFSVEPDLDALAAARLARGAKAAGISEFRFLIEPVAAALAYEATLDRDEIVLVADLGGGTSDFTLMRVGPSHRGLSDRRPSILASKGIPIAGDKFDGEIVRAALLNELGAGSNYVAMTDPAPVPHWIFMKLLQWNHVSFLKSKDTLAFLKRVHQTSDRPDAIGKLISLIEEDQGYLLFRAVERAKRELAKNERARIADAEHALVVEAEISREEFEIATRKLVDQIEGTAKATLEAGKTTPAQVDAVFMTGGTSLLAPVRARFEALFGAEKIRGGQTFTSVVEGLARAGSGIF